MTEKLYDIDSHLKEFTANVISCEQKEDKYIVVLDKTAFFPEGGGQGADHGTIDGIRVEDVQINNGIIYHYLENSLETGREVVCELDWKRRFRHMQNHSGEHIVSGLVHTLYGYDNIGFHLGETEMTLDFNGLLTRDDLLKIEALANEAIYKNARFTAVYPSAEELSKTEYRSKLDLSENVRIVTVAGYDVCACCAPHVSSACEIGIIKILDFCKNKGGVRLLVKCGADALDDYNEKYENVLKISNQLSVKQHETAVAVESLTNQISELKYLLSNIKKKLTEERIKFFKPESEITYTFEEDLDIKELQLFADALNKKSPGIRAVFSDMNGTYAFAICGQNDKLDTFFYKFKKNLTVKGGGRNGMVQGTTSSDKKDIENFFISYNNK